MAVDVVSIIRGDMELFHDGPVGVLEAINGWGSGANMPEATTRPSGWSHYVMWAHLTRDATEAYASLSTTDRNRAWRDPRARTGNRAPNTRVQLRHHQILWLLSNGSWLTGQYRDSASPVLFPFNWSEGSEINMPSPNYTASHPGGGSSMRAVGLSNDPRNPGNPNQYRDRVWHPFGSRLAVPANYVGWVTCLFARLVVDDPTQPDDRAQCNLVGGCAFDWYISANPGSLVQTGSPSTSTVWYGGFSRFKYLSPAWQILAHTNLSESQLRANPPPITGVSLLEQPLLAPTTRIFPATVARDVANAVSTAVVGGKRLAGAQALSTAIGTNYRLRLRRAGSTVLDATYQGTLPVSANGIEIPAYTTLVSLLAADADTPAYGGAIDPAGWVMRVGRADDSVYVEGAVGSASSGAPFRLSADLDPAKGFQASVVLAFSPSIDG